MLKGGWRTNGPRRHGEAHIERAAVGEPRTTHRVGMGRPK